MRNLTLVGLAKDPKIKGKLAAAFGISAEMLRRLNRRVEADGVKGIRPSTNKGGRKSTLTPTMRKKFHELFEENFNAHQAFIELGEKARVTYRSVRRLRQTWKAQRADVGAPASNKQLEFVGLGAGEADAETPR